MNLVLKFSRERLIKAGCLLVQIACYFALAFYVFGLVLSVMGRQTFTVHTSTGTYDRVVYA